MAFEPALLPTGATRTVGLKWNIGSAEILCG